MEKLYVLRIEAYPTSTSNNFFAVRLEKKGIHNRYISYEFDNKSKLREITGEKIYEMILSKYGKRPLRKLKLDKKANETQKATTKDSFFDPDLVILDYVEMDFDKIFKYQHQAIVIVSPKNEHGIKELE